MDSQMKNLIDGLNEDLSYELTAVHQYIYNAAVVSGLARLTLKDFFLNEANDEMVHAQYLSEKIASLGGEPIIQAKPISSVQNVKEMLQSTLQAEMDTIERYTKRIEQAEAVRDLELKLKLEDFIADETKHKEEMQRLLRDSRL